MTKPLNKPETPTLFDPYDPAVIRGLAEAVGMGECIAFPNGLTIDKRAAHNHHHYYPTQVATATAGWQSPSWWFGTPNAGGTTGGAPMGNF